MSSHTYYLRDRTKLLLDSTLRSVKKRRKAFRVATKVIASLLEDALGYSAIVYECPAYVYGRREDLITFMRATVASEDLSLWLTPLGRQEHDASLYEAINCFERCTDPKDGLPEFKGR